MISTRFFNKKMKIIILNFNRSSAASAATSDVTAEVTNTT